MVDLLLGWLRGEWLRVLARYGCYEYVLVLVSFPFLYTWRIQFGPVTLHNFRELSSFFQ
jgi:hypothetical protein